MPQSHKHKQLRATEMSLSDCAINDVTEKQNKQQTCPSQTHDQQDWINIKLSSGELRLVSHSALNSTLCSANKHIIVPWCVSDRIIRAGMDSPARTSKEIKKETSLIKGNSSLGRWVLNCSYSRHNLLACIIYTKCKCLIAFLHFFAIPKTTGL